MLKKIDKGVAAIFLTFFLSFFPSDYSVSIQKWFFSTISSSIPCSRLWRDAQSLDLSALRLDSPLFGRVPGSLDLANPAAAGLNWKPHRARVQFTAGHYLAIGFRWLNLESLLGSGPYETVAWESFANSDKIHPAQANWLGNTSDKSTPKVDEFVQVENHRIMFFLGPGLVGELAADELGRRLSQYVEDLNVIFGKQTIRRFSFDPETDITITSSPPPMGYYVGRLPESGYEIWIHAVLTDNPAYGSNGGGAYFGRNGAGVACKLKWDAVHDPSVLVDGSEELEQYWRQIDHITHEIEHIFGAGIGEYYRLSIVDDTTGYDPIQSIGKNASDPYWSQHQDYFADPLFNNIWNSDLVGNPTSREALLDMVSFADVTVGVVNRGPRNADSMLATLPDLTGVKVEVVDKQSGLPLPKVLVMVWNVNSISPYPNEIIAQGSTDVSGEFEFTWAPYPGMGAFVHDVHSKLVKFYLEGYEPEAKWVSIYDCQEEKVVRGMDQMIIQVDLSEESEITY